MLCDMHYRHTLDGPSGIVRYSCRGHAGWPCGSCEDWARTPSIRSAGPRVCGRDSPPRSPATAAAARPASQSCSAQPIGFRFPAPVLCADRMRTPRRNLLSTSPNCAQLRAIVTVGRPVLIRHRPNIATSRRALLCRFCMENGAATVAHVASCGGAK